MNKLTLNGSCNCGSVAFTVRAEDRATACHCGQCRKQSGHHWASGQGAEDDFEIKGDVRWYAASDIAKRGFCATCGCFLFWKHNDETKMSFSLGVIDGPTSLRLQRNIFTEFQGDYYDLPCTPGAEA
jgi:hypothetical protein